MQDTLPLYLPPVPGTFCYVSGLEEARKHEYHVGRTGRIGTKGRIEFWLHRDTIFDRERFENDDDETREPIKIYIETKYLTRLAYPSLPSSSGEMHVLTVMDCPFNLKGLEKTFQRKLRHNGDVMRVLFEYLIVKPVTHAEVRVSKVSSTADPSRPIDQVLNAKEYQWWISKVGTMPKGIGSEWIEFRFPKTRRVSFVGVRIPELPHGPLSVRNFYLEWFDFGSNKTRRSPENEKHTFETLNMGTLQVLRIPVPFDTDRVRFVCTRSAHSYAVASVRADPHADDTYTSVGMFQVCFA